MKRDCLVKCCTDKRRFKQNLGTKSKIKGTAFEWWFVSCIETCANELIGPFGYKWDLKNCDKWREMFVDGLTPMQAINIMFPDNQDKLVQ
jgi:hypothetical protein